MSENYSDLLIRSRRELMQGLPEIKRAEEAAEGGCGVLGFAASIPVAGRHILAASAQMHNRGNGKGGGIAMVGLDPTQARVDVDTLRSHYILQIALLDQAARGEVEAGHIEPFFEVRQAYALDPVDDYREVPGLEVRPPDVWRYFVRVKGPALERFAVEKGLEGLPARAVEDEFVYQNSFLLNRQFYASLGEKRAFVLSHGRNLSVLKIVGYAEQVVAYYRLEETTAHVWIAHQRYPTKGKVWHPGGAHPFIGLNEALVHNGDFANYHAVSEYLRQRNIGQLFLTDTEVSVQLFDLWERTYGYPLEITLEALAPTTEHDFLMLPPEKQEIYRAVQRAHIHGSPDGPWFFILARSLPDQDRYELLGITDTSMLRPQVFALYENGEAQIGLIASERQAINACLRSLSSEDERFLPVADCYWAARGGSHTDGGAFRFTFSPRTGLACEDKFGQPVALEKNQVHAQRSALDPQGAPASFRSALETETYRAYDDGGAPSLWRWLKGRLPEATWDELAYSLDWLKRFGGQGEAEWIFSLDVLTRLKDRQTGLGHKKRASLMAMIDQGLAGLFEQVPGFCEPSGHSERAPNLPKWELSDGVAGSIRRLTWEIRHSLASPKTGDSLLVLNGLGFPPEGEESAARWMVRGYELGWRRQLVYNWRGGRFAACGIGPDSAGARFDLYGDVGDYTASGLDGAEVHIHGAGQDQYGQIMKGGRLVIHGDVGQTFLYGAKGGEIFVQGSAAGRPLINAVGRPRVVINGTCLDYLAESFMAGDPHLGGGFVILNGVHFDEAGRLQDLPTPYPGGNLFSLATGGAIFLRDPYRRVEDDQLNGGRFADMSAADWALIEPYLRENERLFEILVEQLLRVDGEIRPPQQVYRKVQVDASEVLSEGSNR